MIFLVNINYYILHTIYYRDYIMRLGDDMSTTIRVSKQLAEILEREKKLMGVRSIEEVILSLLREKRRDLINKYFGVDKGKISRFTEEDRLDSRI